MLLIFAAVERSLGFDIHAINYVTKYATEIKAKFSYCDQIKFLIFLLHPLSVLRA